MGLFTILALPVLGPSKLTGWLAGSMHNSWLEEALDEGRVRGELLELQQRYDAGELEDEEYDRMERILLQQLRTIRELKDGGAS